jgi:hypothetical protein
VDGRGLAADVVELIEVLLDDPGGPEHLLRGQCVADGVIGQLVLLAPDRRVVMQFWHPSGLQLH